MGEFEHPAQRVDDGAEHDDDAGRASHTANASMKHSRTNSATRCLSSDEDSPHAEKAGRVKSLYFESIDYHYYVMPLPFGGAILTKPRDGREVLAVLTWRARSGD
jgi:hypothetical protein